MNGLLDRTRMCSFRRGGNRMAVLKFRHGIIDGESCGENGPAVACGLRLHHATHFPAGCPRSSLGGNRRRAHS
jgi:hypothetical protein